jgi:branched-chain amino acid transport system substrate-binding protein
VVNSAFVRYAGGAAEGAMSWEYGRPLAQLPDGPRFAQKYRSRYGTDVLAYAPFGYDAAWAAIKAMQAANSTSPDAYRPFLKKVDFEGITGRISFNTDGSLKSGLSTLYQVKNGQWVTIVTKSAT